jgi:ATP-dependent Clp protease protease subunit
MAKLCIYNEIVDEETKVMYRDWFGMDSVCYKDIHDFISNIDEGDNAIELKLHCPGGDCIEGWAIYDALRQSGKEISATIEGQCSSMATIILLAAPKERRFAFANAKMCIHNPSLAWLDLCTMERLTADELEKMKGKLDAQQLSLMEEQNKILDLYVERTGTDRETLQNLMNEDKFVDMEKAKELGFISDTLAPNTATKTTKSNKNMEETKVKKNLLDKALRMLGLSKIEDVESAILNQKITAADGSEFTVEREDGDPQVGDKAYPNGTYTLDDGTVIVVADEKIESITPADNNDDDDVNALKQQVADLTSQVETLTAENTALKEEKSNLESEKSSLEQQVQSLTTDKENLTAAVGTLTSEKQALVTDKANLEAEKQTLTENQKSEEEKAIIATVTKAGGKAWLDNVCKMQSTFHPGNRTFVESKGQGKRQEGETRTQQMLREERERQEAKRNARK